MGIPHSASLSPLSPLGEACSRMDLTAIHEILEGVGYKDDEGMTNEVRIITLCKIYLEISPLFHLLVSLHHLVTIVHQKIQKRKNYLYIMFPIFSILLLF